MTLTFEPLRRAAAPAALAGALLALPGLASAGAITSATANALFSVFGLPTGVTAEYQFAAAQTNSSTTAGGNAVASTLQTPSADLTQNLALNPFVEQDSQSEAMAYKNTAAKDAGSDAAAFLSNEGTILFANTTGAPVDVTLNWQYFLNVSQTVTGLHSFADAYARAEVLISDFSSGLLIQDTAEVEYPGAGILKVEDMGSALLSVPAGGMSMVSVQLNTQTNAEYVPLPATTALLALGLFGLRSVRRRIA
ncbi:hypothetical protein [uncultured Thiohalocapsa sp.]|uniref:hypothetical protein n=1 Tax=uncultured Thiohalocapsa sp. TaxID=768990 RepID=UPI0025F35837|nr:hypothetical protein [uncultured Thiohalocapsa sp.]